MVNRWMRPGETGARKLDIVAGFAEGNGLLNGNAAYMMGLG